MSTPYWQTLFNCMYIETPAEADEQLEKLIAWAQQENPALGYAQARDIQLSNLGWMFGEVNRGTREHAMKIWPEAHHPIFDRNFDRDPDEVLRAGMAIGEAMRQGKTIAEALEDRGTPQS